MNSERERFALHRRLGLGSDFVESRSMKVVREARLLLITLASGARNRQIPYFERADRKRRSSHPALCRNFWGIASTMLICAHVPKVAAGGTASPLESLLGG